MLKINRLETSYGNVKALRNVSLKVDKGALITLIGANGAGKTTLLKTISGVVRPTVGEILLDGKRIDQASSHEIVRQGISHCPEGRKIWPKMTVLENLEMGAYTIADRKEIKNNVEKMFHHFPILAERRDQKAGKMSGGEQQMLAIGRALMAKPKLLLLDEPSLGLSPMMVEQVAEIIKGIHGQGVTVLLVEQNAFLALNMADWAYVLEVGHIVMEGPAKDLLANDFVRKSYLGL